MNETGNKLTLRETQVTSSHDEVRPTKTGPCLIMGHVGEEERPLSARNALLGLRNYWVTLYFYKNYTL